MIEYSLVNWHSICARNHDTKKQPEENILFRTNGGDRYEKHIHSPFQRILSLVLCLTMLLPAIIVPGSASETA